MITDETIKRFYGGSVEDFNTTKERIVYAETCFEDIHYGNFFLRASIKKLPSKKEAGVQGLWFCLSQGKYTSKGGAYFHRTLMFEYTADLPGKIAAALLKLPEVLEDGSIKPKVATTQSQPAEQTPQQPKPAPKPLDSFGSGSGSWIFK